MRPARIKPGQKLSIASSDGGSRRTGYFIKRVAAQAGRKAKNFIRVPDHAGLNGPDDDGTCEMSDYEISRRAFPAK